ncbi:cation acetate symporter [Streptomyces sp. JJ38]|uniref:sodium/solute symporter n=1 Tax=Streptomyces sp. JJ38 TaxID=2738128 RepID=UPI001C59DFB8|nr:cation acetate symporter [Streptomyces sp. JJ38]MBW1596088.1 cation acetate symporter [Streptomyces sp. JJ38]
MTGFDAGQLAVGAVDAQERELVLISFLAFVALSLLLCVMAGPEGDDTADFYAGNRSLSPRKNALALAGDYLSAATLLGTSGFVALSGYDGMALAVATALALGGLLLVAGPLRRAGGYTLGDVFALRSPGPAARIAAAVIALAISLPFLVVQLSAAGRATALLIGLGNPGAEQVCTAFIGVLMVFYTVLGGMKGTSLVQIVKVTVAFTTMAALAVWVLQHFDWSPAALLAAAAQGSGSPDTYLDPGRALGTDATGRLDFLGLQLSIVLGGACMPHILMRIGTAGSGAAAREATQRAVTLVAVFCCFVVIAGLGAAAVVGGRAITAVDGSGQASLMLLAAELGEGKAGSALFVAVACTVFVTVLAVVAGIALSAAAALAHDVYAHAVRGDRATERDRVRAARWSVAAVGSLSVVVTVTLQGYNVQGLIHLTLSLAAATVLPACLYGMFWRRFNRTGLLCTVYGGLLCTVVLFLVSAAFSGSPDSLLPDRDLQWIGLRSTALLAIPAGFLLGWAGSLLAPGGGRVTARAAVSRPRSSRHRPS